MLKNARFGIVCMILALTGLFVHLHSDISVPARRPFHEFPSRNKDWRMISQSNFSKDVLAVLAPTDYIARRYIHPEAGPLFLYIGYHGSGGVHSPRHCLPGSGWFKVSEEKMALDAGGKELNLVKAVYQKDGDRELLLYWYQVRGKSLADEYSLKLAEIMNSLFSRRRDLAFIRISLPVAGEEGVPFSAGVRFIRDFYPVIEDFLPK